MFPAAGLLLFAVGLPYVIDLRNFRLTLIWHAIAEHVPVPSSSGSWSMFPGLRRNRHPVQAGTGAIHVNVMKWLLPFTAYIAWLSNISKWESQSVFSHSSTLKVNTIYDLYMCIPGFSHNTQWILSKSYFYSPDLQEIFFFIKQWTIGHNLNSDAFPDPNNPK